MKVALVYDRVNKIGGAERVLLALHSLFPSSPLYTAVYSPKHAQWANIFSVKTSFLQNFPFARRNHEVFPLLMPLAFENFSFEQYDLVISITSEAAKGIITNGKTKHICYCLTPTRYLWSGYDFYFKNTYMRLLAKPAIQYLRHWDTIAAKRPDAFIAISKEVQQRIKKYYQRDSEIIYPPLFLQSEKKDIKKLNEPPFLLIVSRLVSYKRIDLAIQACNSLRLPLRIIGSGNALEKLRRIAGPTVQFLGNLTDDEVIAYYKSCSGFIFPGQEDFGLSMVEAQYYGKPVLAYNAGGAREIIVEGKTGMFFDKPTIASLTKALDKFIHFRYNREDCQRQAENFTLTAFQSQFLKIVEDVLKQKI